MAEKLQITLKRSLIGCSKSQRVTVHTLGLRKINQSVEQPDKPSTWGMIDKVRHLVEVKEVNG